MGETQVLTDDFEKLTLSLAELFLSSVITVGVDGAGCAQGSPATAISAPVAQVVDTTGAEEAYVGASTALLNRSDDLANACCIGLTVRSRAVQHRGAQLSVKDRG